MSFELERAGYRMRVDLPSRDDDFRDWSQLPGDRYSALGGPATIVGRSTYVDPDAEEKQPLPHHEWDFVSIYVLRVSVEIDDGIGRFELEAAESDAELASLHDSGLEVVNAARDAALAVVEDVVAWARAEWDQSWLGLSSEVPETAGPTRVVEVDTGSQAPISPSIHLHTGTLRRDFDALGTDDVKRLFASVATSEPPPLAESFLADAEYLTWGHFPYDPTRAVLMAAIAAEVKVKSDLVTQATQDQRELVDYALGKQREITLTAVDGLFDKFMKAAQGRSLREDDRELFKRLGKLFEIRNSIAHAGATPDLESARDAVRAAREAIRWVELHRAGPRPER